MVEGRSGGVSSGRSPLSGCDGEATALADAGRNPVRAASSALDLDALVRAVEVEAEALGVELAGRVTARHVKTKAGTGKGIEVRAGRAKLATLTRHQAEVLDVSRCFEMRRSLLLSVGIPKSVSWSEWSEPVRATQWALGRLMDRAAVLLRIGEVTGSGKSVYQTIVDPEAQDELRAEAARVYARTKSPKWKARSEFTLSGAAASQAARQVEMFYRRWKLGEIGFPSWSGPNGSIPLRAAELTFERDGDDVRCRLPIFAGRGNGHECFVWARGFAHQRMFDRILDGEIRHGDGRLIWDDRKRRWQIQLSYALPRPKSAEARDTPVYLVVRRDVRDVLQVSSSTGREGIDIRGSRGGPSNTRAIGVALLEARGKFHRVRKTRLERLPLLGRGARGRGRARLFRDIRRCSDDEAKTVDTLLRQLASAIVRRALAEGVHEILVEDMSLEWRWHGASNERFARVVERTPWSKAVEYLKQQAQEFGIRIRIVARAQDDLTCPSCGAEAKRDGEYTDCEGCGLLVDRRLVAAWNMFKSAGVDDTALKEVRLKASYMTREMRKKVEKQNERRGR